jgi:hypothetical protein
MSERLSKVRFDRETRIARVYRFGELVASWEQTGKGWIAYGASDTSDAEVGPLLDKLTVRYPYEDHA